MKKSLVVVFAFVCVFVSRTGLHAKGQGKSRAILAFETMYGVDGPFVGEANPIRGLIGDELPWEIHKGRGVLRTNGHLKVHVRGLVFKDVMEVPPEKRGKNDEAQFRARVSCLSEAGTQVVEKDVTTAGFKATTSGDSDIDATIALPQPCVAPIVFILAGSEDKWFAVTGFEAEGG